MPVPARAASPATALRHARRGIERPRGTFVGGGAAATLCALSSRAALSFVFGLGSRAGAASLRASWGVPRRRRRLRGREGLRAEPENQGQNRWCFFRGNGRLGRRREPWRGRGAPGEGWGGDAFDNPVLLAKANAARKKRWFLPRLSVWLHTKTPAQCRVLATAPALREKRRGAAPERPSSPELSSQFAPRAAPTGPSTPASARQQQPNQNRHPLRNHGGAPPRRER